MLTRQDFCTVIKLNVETFKTLTRPGRDQLPFFDGHQGFSKYTEFDALLVLCADDLAQDGGLSRSRACSIVLKAAPLIKSRLSEIIEIGRGLTLGHFASDGEILAVVADQPGLSGPFVFVGTLSEISAAVALATFPLDLVRGHFFNPTRGVASMIVRADRERIELDAPFNTTII